MMRGVIKISLRVSTRPALVLGRNPPQDTDSVINQMLGGCREDDETTSKWSKPDKSPLLRGRVWHDME